MRRVPLKVLQTPKTGILDLPERVRVKILKFLTYKERAEVQLVCRKFRNEIRMRVGLQSRVTDVSRQGLLFMRDVIIDTVTVGCFLEPTITPTQIIGNPDKVKHLVFEESIAIEMIDAFLSRCLKLESIVFAAAPLPLEYFSVSPSNNQPLSAIRLRYAVSKTLRCWEVISKAPFVLENLRTLSLVLPGRKSIFFFQKLLTLVHCPNLVTFSLRIGSDKDRVDSRLIHTRIFHFLKKYQGLRNLFISTAPEPCDSKILNSLTLVGLPKTEIMTLSTELKLKSIVLTEPTALYQIWSVFLAEQHKLEVFQVLQHLQVQVMTPIIQRNAKTLRKIAIHVPLRQKDGYHNPMNLEIFRDCVGLEELMIDLSRTTMPKAQGDVENSASVPNVILLRELPKSLRVLALRDCAFLTHGLIQMKNQLNKLESLGLVCMKDLSAGFGVNYATLLQLLRYPSLNELLVTGIRVSDRDRVLLRRVKESVNAEMRLNRTGIYIGHPEKPKCRWVMGPKSSCFFRFGASSWGVTESEPW